MRRYIALSCIRPDDRRATPAEYYENGQDYMPTDRRVLFGHHFAAIAGAGPLVGPVLAAQLGYLPGTAGSSWGWSGRCGAGLPGAVLLDAPWRPHRWGRWPATSWGWWVGSPP